MSGQRTEIRQLQPTLTISQLLQSISDALYMPPTCIQLLDDDMQLLTAELDKKLCEIPIKAGTILTLMNSKLAPPSLKQLCPVNKISGTDYPLLVVSVKDQLWTQIYELRKCLRTSRPCLAEFENEVEVLRDVESPFIRALVTTYHTPRSLYALYEYVHGIPMSSAVGSLGAMSRPQAAFYSGSLLIALQALSSRIIIHRNIKSETALLNEKGYVKLIGFEISKKLGDVNNRTYTMLGTPHYMAPEVMRGHGYGLAVDIWSLGCMLYEFVVGRLPFADELDEPAEVCSAILKGALSFPETYSDNAGRELIKGLLVKKVSARLSADFALNSNYFFMCDPSFFEKLTGRVLRAPLLPEREPVATQACSQAIADEISDGELESSPDF